MNYRINNLSNSIRVKLHFMFFSFSLLFFSTINAYSQKDTVLIFHPTVTNIKTINFLFNDVITQENLNNIHFLGVYHMNEGYDYQISKNYIASQDDNQIHFSLLEITDIPDPSTLFTNNSLTEPLRRLFKNSIGAFFLGGPDLPPSIYNEEMNLLTEVTDPWRHYLEVSAVFNLLGSKSNLQISPYLEDDPNYLILGICLGMQTLNVGTGGTMVQDIPTEIYNFESREAVLNKNSFAHRNYFFDDPSDDISLTGYHVHQINIQQKGLFKRTFIINNELPYVLSSHHQAIEDLGLGLIPVAWSMDGKIIEAIAHEKYASVFGVQFHPEKPGIFVSDETHYVNRDSLINFNAYLNEHQSFQFHKNFWNAIGKLLIENKKHD